MASLPAGSNGPATLIEANQATDQVVYGALPSASTLLADQSSGLIAPTALVTADLGGNGLPDLIFANGGGDNVLVYPGLPGWWFGTRAERRARLLHGDESGRDHCRRRQWRRSTRPDRRE